MRSTLVIFTAALAAAALGGCQKNATQSQASSANATPTGPAAPTATATDAGTPLTPDSAPHRKPGLWKMSMTMDGHQTMSDTQCVGPDTDRSNDAAWAGRATNDKTCKPVMNRMLDGSIHINVVCDMGKMKVTSDGVVRGDFNDHYSVHMDTTMSGAPIPAANAHHVMDMQSQWVGPCK